MLCSVVRSNLSDDPHHRLLPAGQGGPKIIVTVTNYQCCESWMFIPDPNFSIPYPGSASKNLSILTQKIVSKLLEI
jgi:hypothetical protein